jgi:hypothetical protein
MPCPTTGGLLSKSQDFVLRPDEAVPCVPLATEAKDSSEEDWNDNHPTPLH